MRYIDLTHTFNGQMPVFPGDPASELKQTTFVEKDGFSHFHLNTSLHVGTHMDAPSHMLMGGKLLNEYPVEKFFGRGVVIDARGKTSVGAELLSGMDIKSGDVVLICFGWSEVFHNDEYYLNYPVISEGFAKKLVELGVAMVGMDTPSPDKAPYGVHKILLKQDILIIENLTNLETLFAYPNWEIVALPAKLEAEAGLCRVVAKIL